MKRNFYPMITSTLRSALCRIEPNEMFDYVLLILNYPNLEDSLINMKDDITHIIISELDRQYERWNKGDNNAVQKH